MNSQILCQLGAVVLLLSCNACDKSYDLSKDINTDITVGKEFSVPVGKTDTVFATRIIKPSETLTVNSSGIFEVSTSGSASTDIEAVPVVNVPGITPIIGSTSIDFPSSQTVKARSTDFEYPLETKGEYSINVLLPKEIESINTAYFSSEHFLTYLVVETPQIPAGIESLTVKDMTITLPSIFKLSNGSNQLKVDNFTLSSSNSSKRITIEIASIHITEEQEKKYIVSESDGKHFIVNKDEITVTASTTTSISNPLQILGKNLTINFAYSSGDGKNAVIEKVGGTFSTDADFNENITLNDIPDFIKGDGTHFTPANVYMDLSLNNPTDMTLSSQLSITSKKGNSITAGPVDISLSAKPTIVNKYIISNTARTVESDYTNIVNPQLSDLLNTVPDEFEIATDKIKLNSNTNNELFVLGKPYHSNINYDVNVPFEFKNISIEYCDSIDNLLSDLKDASDKTDELIVTAVGVSTIPTDLHAKVELFDIAGNKLNNINVDLTQFEIVAGTEAAPSVNNLKITLTEANGFKELEQLEKIRYTIYAESNDDLILKSNSYVVVKDIIAKITKGINVSF